MAISIPQTPTNQTTKPALLKPIPGNIPNDLRARRRWLCWRIVPDRETGKPRKIPFSPATGKPASTTEPADWTTFDRAWEAYRQQRHDGPGFVFVENDGLVGVDLDHVVDEAGNVDQETREWVERFRSYTEISPSGHGLHIYVRGRLPRGGFKKDGKEIYGDGRYFAITGHEFGETPIEIVENQEAIDAFIKRFFEETIKRPQRKPETVRRFATWAELRHELGERIRNHETARRNSSGNYDCRAICHDGKGSTGLFYDPAVNQATCNKGCDQTVILRAFGLPDKPDGPLRTKQTPPPPSAGETATGTVRAQVTEEPADEEQWVASRTDEGNAQRFFRRWHDELRYCEIWQSWLYWDSRRWMRDYGSQAGERARITARDIGLEAAQSANTELLKWAARSLDAGKIDAILRLARKMPAFIVKPDELDRHPMLLNVRNGTIDLRSGDLREHRREDYMTKCAPVGFDPEAKAPLFDQFLLEVFENDDLVRDVQRLAGYSITGDVSGRIMPICWGSGRNGKNTFLETITHILGDDYSTTIDPDILLISRDRTPLHELAALDGIRFAVTDEVQEGRRLAESLVKRLTGSRSIHACRKYEHPYDFQVQFKIWMLTNHKPIVRDQTHAMWDRLRLVPFEKRFYMPDDEDIPAGAPRADTGLPGKLLAESPGILNWLIAGCLGWQQDGLPMSEQVRTASRAYRVESDTIGRFFEECCVQGEDYRILSSALLKAYNEWSGENLSSQKFKPLLEIRGVDFERNYRGNWVLGAALRTANFDSDDSDPDEV